MLEIHVGELLDRLALGGLSGLGGDDPADDPLVVVDCGHPAPGGVDTGAVAASLSGVPAVLVAVGAAHPVGPLLDVTADGPATVDRLATAVAGHPQAAVALAVLLRGGGDRSVPEGLAAESATYATLQAGAEHRRWLDGHGRRRRPPDGERPAVAVHRDGDRLRLTLDRPAVRNAFSARLRDELIDALAVAAAEPTVRITLDAAGPSFCSGGDLDEFGTTPDPATAHLVRLHRSAGRALHAVADRLTVHTHGACVGAGVELAAFARRVTARSGATFRLPELAMGLVPGAGGTVSLPRRIGRQRTALMALLATPVDTATALRWGLVDEITD